jgi:hypothetical protein
MKKFNTLLLATVLGLSVAGPGGANERAAPAHDHAHEHGAEATTLQLNDGRKWETDAPLRASMGRIRKAMSGALHAIHADRLSPKAYDRLAQTVEREVGRIVAECRLPAAADAQLHLVVAELLAGAERMAGKADGQRRAGAVQVIGALDDYGGHFDHAGFKPLAH